LDGNSPEGRQKVEGKRFNLPTMPGGRESDVGVEIKSTRKRVRKSAMKGGAVGKGNLGWISVDNREKQGLVAVPHRRSPLESLKLTGYK